MPRTILESESRRDRTVVLRLASSSLTSRLDLRPPRLAPPSLERPVCLVPAPATWCDPRHPRVTCIRCAPRDKSMRISLKRGTEKRINRSLAAVDDRAVQVQAHDLPVRKSSGLSGLSLGLRSAISHQRYGISKGTLNSLRSPFRARCPLTFPLQRTCARMRGVRNASHAWRVTLFPCVRACVRVAYRYPISRINVTPIAIVTRSRCAQQSERARR